MGIKREFRVETIALYRNRSLYLAVKQSVYTIGEIGTLSYRK